MAPSPQELLVEVTSESKRRPLAGNEVVISGMSGIFPSSNSVSEFSENLYNKVDMVSTEDPRWIFNHPEVPKHLGQVNGMGKFDAQFFRVHYKQACTMEPMSRKLLEHAYSAIYDSGINPLQLRGRKVGVFIGSTFSESEKIVIYETIQRNGFGITGCNKAMYANRISYWIDGKGPSYALDLACASSMACLEHAYRSISTGQCDAAIVGGCNLCMQPSISLNLRRAGFLCLDGKTKCFDKNGDGYVRSDAISVLFLQKAQDAKRIYSEVYHAFGNYSLRPDAEFLPLRQPKDIMEFLEAFYSSIDVSPSEVEYVEAYGSAIAEADRNELEAIGQVFAKNRTIKVGSVKSNMGHSEPASGVCAVTKVCLAYHKGVLPANLHYYEPQDNIPSVSEGKIQVLQDHATFNRGFTALNSFSYTGANIHVLLKGHYKAKDPERYRSSIPYLVLTSGRQESCVSKILNVLKNQPVDPEQIGLLQNIHNFEIPGHMCRGYTILDTNANKDTVSLAQSIDYYSGSNVPVWFVYSGMGSQWAGMGAALMAIPIFAAAIERCHRVLEPKGVNLMNILTNPDKTIYDNILNSFVGIAAVQIGLTDVLKEMGVVPDNIIGHSVGELGCAYADGCFTAEEMILAAYSRGLVSVQTPFIKGSMAAVGMGYKAVLPLCPPEIEVACHNSSESATISGPADKMKEFVTELTSQGIFAKEVPCSNIAYHSQYISGAGPGLLKYLSEVVKTPKARSSKWVSTSVPEENWTEEKAKYSSAEYHTNNLLNPVLFEETSNHIPKNALLIEIAPHGLLQAILKRSHNGCTNIPLTRRGHADPVKFLLEAVGKLYQAGLNPKVDVLYPKIEFPVATETPMLSHLVEWEHSEDWPQAKYNSKDRVTATTRDFVMSIHDDDFKNLNGYIRNGAYVFPEAALLVLIWETFAMQKGVKYTDMSVVFKNVHFHGEAYIRTEVPLTLGIMIHKGNNMFEVSFENTQIVSGVIQETKMYNSEHEREFENASNDGDDSIILNSNDIYKIMNNRGFIYKNEFQSIKTANCNRTQAALKWNEDWTTFLDSVIQFTTFARDYDGVSVPKLIKCLSINTTEHEKIKQVEVDGATCYNAALYKIYNVARCGGVYLDSITFTDKPKVEPEANSISERTFVPHFISEDVDVQKALRINLQIVADNIVNNKMNITNFETTGILAKPLKAISDEITSKKFDFNVIDANTSDYVLFTSQLEAIKKSNLLIFNNLLDNEQKMKIVFERSLPKNTFVLTLESKKPNINNKLFHLITSMKVENQILVLFKKVDEVKDPVTYIPVTLDTKFSWLERAESEFEKSRRVVLVSERQPYCGLLGYVKTTASKYQNKLGLVIVDDYHAPSFNPENTFYKEQMLKNLTYNIFKQGQWGGYYDLPCAQSTKLQNFTLTCGTPGDIESITWNEAPFTSPTKSSIQVCYSGLSFRDAQVAVGKVKGSSRGFGMDFSGVDCRGKKVMGVVPGDAVASSVKSDLDLLWPVPEHWSLEDAATVPLPYVHAFYCLVVKSNLRKGSSVFVSGGAGALGQAIISICLALDCTVYTVVSDIQKKRFLKRLFPKLEEKNIGCSRDDSFTNMVVLNSNDLRCDLVINCYSGSLRKAAMKCAGFTGFFLDINDVDMNENSDFGMFYLFEEKSYKAVHLPNLFVPENSGERKMLQSLIAEGIAKGIVKPLSRVIYEPEEVHRAFHLLSSSRHRGRVLIRMRDPVKNNHGVEVKPVITFSPISTYVVVSDRQGMGIDLADRLVKRGAKKLLIHVKPECVNGYLHTKMAYWKKSGATVALFSENVKTEKGCLKLLEEGKKLGKINGIFIVQELDLHKNVNEIEFATNYNETTLVVANLDMISRKVCTELSDFVVISTLMQNAVDAYNIAASDKICQARNELGLPALAFHIDNPENISISGFFKSLETSMKLKYNNVVAKKQNTRKANNFFKKIAVVLGVNKIEDVPENLTLSELSLNDVNIEEIRSIISDSCRINILPERLKKMTVASLQELEKSLTEQNVKFNSGLGAFYTYIDEDECLATEPMVAMPTKLSNATETEDELDPKATYLMLLPGFEGHHQIFKSISQRLKVHAMAFQLGPDLSNDTIPEMAANIMKFMKKRFELKSKFYLLGYSFGVNVALELALLLEKEGHVGIVYCLDSSPDALRTQLDSYIGDQTDTELQNLIVEHMYQLMTGRQSQELNNELKTIEKWTDKIDACVSRLRGQVNYSNQYKISVLEAAYRRIRLARDYIPNFKLQSELVLLKGIPHPKAENLDVDYNLSKYTVQPVQIYDIKSDHASAPMDCRVSNIVNRLLDSQILEEFKQKNLCDTYLADPFKIL